MEKQKGLSMRKFFWIGKGIHEPMQLRVKGQLVWETKIFLCNKISVTQRIQKDLKGQVASPNHYRYIGAENVL